MCSFVRERMALALVQANTLLMWGGWYKEARIHHHPELSDGAVMKLMAPWRGYMNNSNRVGDR